MTMIIKNAKIFDGDKFIAENTVIIEGRKIKKVTSTSFLTDEDLKNNEVIDIDGKVLSPGFIDLQLNGCGGVLFNDEITRETLEIMNETNKRFGATSYLPTLITSPDEKILKALKLIEDLKDEKEEIGVLGLHIEGPYISLEKKGVHRPDYIRVLSDEVIEAIAKVGYEGVKIMTIAPEVALEKHLIKLYESGINLSIGHSNALYEEIKEKEKYYRNATHLFNAMRPFDSREPGVVGYLLDNKNMNCGIIVDGLHASYPSVRVVKEVLRSKLYLVTDAVSPMGTNMEYFMFEGHKVYYKDGRCATESGTLGGSALDMITGVKNLVKEVKISEEEALRMATSYPAKAVQVDDRYGYIKEGYIADLTYYNEDFVVEGTIAKGQLTKY